MNIWIKSIAAGSVIATAVFFLSEKLNEKKRIKKYSLEYSIEAEPDKGSALPFSLSKIADILEKRLQAAEYKFKIEKSGKTRINVSLFDITDTSFPTSILTANNRVQFRELYTINEVTVMLESSIGVMQGTDPVPVKKTKTTDLKDTVAGKESDLAESLEPSSEVEKNTALSLIEFSHPYQSETGAYTYPSEIGMVKLKDTAATLALFRNEKIRLITPADLQIRFGEPDKNFHKEKKPGDRLIALYFIKTKGSPDTALLENKDISNATQDFDQFGKVEIRMQFNESGARKWAYMTRQNIGRPLAIMINNTVISAPKVLDAIMDGSSSLTGSFSHSEAETLSRSLTNPVLPAKLVIISFRKNPNNTSRQTGKELILALITFIFISGLSFFIFKTLKSTR